MQASQAAQAPRVPQEPFAGRRRRRHASLALVAGAVLALGSVAPASADEQETDALWIAAPYDLVLPTADAQGDAVGNTIEVKLGHDNTNNAITGGKLTVDATELANVADVTWPSDCAPGADALTATCDFGALNTGPYETVAEIGLRAKAGAPADTTGTIHFTADADSSFGPLTGYPTDTQVRLGDGPDLGVNQVPYRTGVAPGSDIAQAIRLSNHGNRTADRTLLTLFASHGLDFAQRFGNCTYLEDDATTHQTGTTAVCVLDKPVAPGQQYDLSAAGAVRATGAALYERFDYSVDQYSDEAYEQAVAGRPFVQGTGADLVPAAVPAARTLSATATEPDLNTEDNYRSTLINADNKADLIALANDIKGVAPGDIVTARVGVKNRGPAWVASLGAGAPAAAIDVTIPQGTTVTGAPDSCYERGTNQYTCQSPIFMWEKDRSTFDFTLRVDRVIEGGAKGSVATVNDNPELRISAFDPQLANNTAEFTVSGS
ncbi:hypothetical protein EOT10_09830 [Streptomyces antnestii]|uniref:DUF11 domain-containing protein n=1 Tax=Streptomyces antnestii TaxID=2494256 RepID=A0A3S2VHL1_9ACTN|nr:hypothetical protein [Streptomyces sp. San01]RVU27452.1 hypothetical protein EOT10_09830 [Streptomyces sp. San01]